MANVIDGVRNSPCKVMLFQRRFGGGWGGAFNLTKARTLCSHQKEAIIPLKFHVVYPRRLVIIEEVFGGNETEIEMFISLLLRQTHLMD